MFNTKYIYTALVLILGMSSCTEIIDMGYTTDDERIVVDATIMDRDTIQYVKLTKINIVLEDGKIVSPISNASVIVSDGSDDIVFTEDADSAGFYVAPPDFIGQNETTYTLTITNTGILGDDGNDFYTSVAYLGNKLSIDSIRVDYVDLPRFGMVGHNLYCFTQDPPEKNWYLFKAWRNGVLLTDTLREYRQTDDRIFNGDYINGAMCQRFRDRKPDEYLELGDTIVLEIDNIDEGYFEYLKSAQDVARGSSPMFGGPPANAISNVTNGAAGVFRTYSPVKKGRVMHVINRPEENEIDYSDL